MNNYEDKMMHEVLIHRYNLGYLSGQRELAEKLHKLGYFDDETGHATEVAQRYFDELYIKYKSKILEQAYKVGGSANKLSYNQVSERVGFPKDTYYLHHFLRKLVTENVLTYREIESFDDILRIRIN